MVTEKDKEKLKQELLEGGWPKELVEEIVASLPLGSQAILDKDGNVIGIV